MIWARPLNELGNVNSPKYGNWVKGLATTDPGNLKGALFELRYSVELKKSGTAIRTLEDYKDGNKAMDLIVADSSNEVVWVELKNKTGESVSGLTKQLKGRLGIGVDEATYGPGNYEYVFAGEPDETYITALCGVAKVALDSKLLTEKQFERFTIKFMRWPQTVEGLLDTVNLTWEPTPVGCRK
jgi:hypothetical protein